MLDSTGVITSEQAIALGATGPILRATGVPWDLRRAMPYLFYEQVDFDVIVGTHGDTFDRYAVRINEIRESMKIVRQVLEHMPAGDYRVQDKKITPPPRARIDESMEALIHHFKLFTEGFRVPPGETYVAIESPRGEIGCYMVSDGSSSCPTGAPSRIASTSAVRRSSTSRPCPTSCVVAWSPTPSPSSRRSTRSWGK